MSTRGSNVERNLWFVDLLELDRTQRVLELGPGPGIALAAATDIITDGEVVGLDHSDTMISQAAKRNRRAVGAGRVVLRKGTVERLPTDLGHFDRIFSMNVWQFWPDQDTIVANLIENHLQDDGILAIGLQPRARGATAADTDAASRRPVDQLNSAGLIDVHAHQLDLAPVPVVAVLGGKRLP